MSLGNRSDTGEFRKQFKFHALFVIAAFLLLIGRLFYLQVLQRDEYQAEAKENIVRRVTLATTRGVVRDSQGKVIASNRPAYSVYLVPMVKIERKLVCVVETDAWKKVVSYLSMPEDERLRVEKKVGEICAWLQSDPSQSYEYLSDVTAVEYRDHVRPIEVVWHIRSIKYRRFLRLKAEIPKDGKTPLEVPSVWPVWKGADWLERECYDMFGITFTGHPDLRRILLWEQYKEGFPLRKDFPLRGRFSRSEQLKNALSQDPEAKYSMEELSVAEAFGHLPEDMRKRLAGGEKVGE